MPAARPRQICAALVRLKPTVVRGNPSEILALAGASHTTKGVDSTAAATGGWVSGGWMGGWRAGYLTVAAARQAMASLAPVRWAGCVNWHGRQQAPAHASQQGWPGCVALPGQPQFCAPVPHRSAGASRFVSCCSRPYCMILFPHPHLPTRPGEQRRLRRASSLRASTAASWRFQEQRTW